jgi:hypothetical protein
LSTHRELEPVAGGSVTLRALRAALGRTPLWLIAGLGMVLLAQIVAQPWYRWFDEVIGGRYAPGSLVGNLDEALLADHRAGLESLDASTRALGAVLFGLATLFGVFVAGGWLQVFLERTHGHSVRRFFYGGSRYFWRFFRVLLVVIPALHLVYWLTHGLPWQYLVDGLLLGVEDGELEVLTSERTVVWRAWFQAGLYFLLFRLVLAWAIYTRTRLALQAGRSAVWAGLCSVFTLLRRPLRTLVPLVLLFVLELAVLLVLAVFAGRIETSLGADSGSWHVVALGGLNVAAILVRAVIWGAQYAAAVEVSRQVVPPVSRPDPWRDRVGPPGGPQYPIGGDEYGVSL